MKRKRSDGQEDGLWKFVERMKTAEKTKSTKYQKYYVYGSNERQITKEIYALCAWMLKYGHATVNTQSRTVMKHRNHKTEPNLICKPFKLKISAAFQSKDGFKYVLLKNPCIFTKDFKCYTSL